jgi:hypothetical protein
VNREEHLNAAPDGTNCVTIVTHEPPDHPVVYISQFLQNEDDQVSWRPMGEPISMPIDQIPDLISMLETVLASAEIT